MLVKELIKLLSSFNQESEVVTHDGEYGDSFEVRSVYPTTSGQVKISPFLDTDYQDSVNYKP